MEFKTGVINVPEETKKTADKVGYLTKQGGKWKTWKRRYFVLKDNFIYYFGDIKDTIPKGVLLLDGIQVSKTADAKRKHCFSIGTRKSFTAKTGWKDRIYLIQADTEEDMESWMKAIQKSSPGKKLPHTSQMTDEATRLFKACGKGESDTVKSILGVHKVDLSITDDEGNTSLHWACVGGFTETVRILLEQGADIEAKSRDGFTPLHSVAQEDHAEVLDILLAKGAKVDIPNTEDNNNTTLHYAACWGALNCTKALLKKGASVDSLALDKSTPLCFAAEKGHVSICKLLIESGANLESKNDPEEKGGATPLLLAAHNGQMEVVKLLIEKGANLKQTTIDGLSCLHLAIRSGSDNSELVKALIEGGADPNAKTNSGDSPLHYAAFMGYIKATAVLLDNNANLEDRGQNFSTPLHFCAREGQYEMTKLLLERGAALDPKDKDGDTPLSCAELNGHTRCVELLVSHNKSKEQKAGSS